MVVACKSNILTKSNGNMNGNKAIKMEVVLKEERSKSLDRGIEKPNKKSGEFDSKDQRSRFEESVQLCCVTMSTGPGTSFGDFQIPSGAKCSVCGAGLSKGRA